jgi:hypothetical protein
MKKAVNNKRSATRSASPDEILVVTGDSGVRGWGSKLKVSELTTQINIFVGQIGEVLDKTPPELGGFQFEEFEITAEITGKGQLALLGTGGEVGATGGIKFLFKRVKTG